MIKDKNLQAGNDKGSCSDDEYKEFSIYEDRDGFGKWLAL